MRYVKFWSFSRALGLNLCQHKGNTRRGNRSHESGCNQPGIEWEDEGRDRSSGAYDGEARNWNQPMGCMARSERKNVEGIIEEMY
jgi:hypothetical protein